jgi:hypothetical protein
VYEEKIINSVLNYRGNAAEDWTPFTAEQLTVKLIEARKPSQPSITHQYIPVFQPYTPPPIFHVTTPAPQPPWTVTCAVP